MKKSFLRVVSFCLCLFLLSPLLTCFLLQAKAAEEDDFQQTYPLGLILDDSTDGDLVASESVVGISSLSLLPESVDNSQLVQAGKSDAEYFPPIRLQILGSCASFASTYYAFTYEVNRYKHEVLGLSVNQYDASIESNQFSPKFAYSLSTKWIKKNDNSGYTDTGDGSTYADNYAILRDFGSISWADMPYDGELELSNNNTLKRKALEYRLDNYFTASIPDNIIGVNDSKLDNIKTAQLPI